MSHPLRGAADASCDGSAGHLRLAPRPLWLLYAQAAARASGRKRAAIHWIGRQGVSGGRWHCGGYSIYLGLPTTSLRSLSRACRAGSLTASFSRRRRSSTSLKRDGLIKIGCTRNLGVRMVSLGAACCIPSLAGTPTNERCSVDSARVAFPASGSHEALSCWHTSNPLLPRRPPDGRLRLIAQPRPRRSGPTSSVSTTPTAPLRPAAPGRGPRPPSPARTCSPNPLASRPSRRHPIGRRHEERRRRPRGGAWVASTIREASSRRL